MGVFNEMKASGLVDNYSLYNGKVRDHKGDLVERLMVDVDYKGSTITLFSESPFVDSEHEIAFALDHTFFHSVKLTTDKKKSIALNRTSIFSSSTVSVHKTYYAERNAIYTPEGIFCCQDGWYENEAIYDKVLGISAVSRSLGLTAKASQMLKDLGAIKLISFDAEEVEQPKEVPNTIYAKLLSLGAMEISKLNYLKIQAQETGHIYSATAILELNGFIYYFEMQHHHKSEEYMAKKEVEALIQLSGISVNGKILIELFPSSLKREGNVSFSLANHTFVHDTNVFFTAYKFVPESIAGKRVTELKALVEIEGLTNSIIAELDSMDFKQIL